MKVCVKGLIAFVLILLSCATTRPRGAALDDSASWTAPQSRFVESPDKMTIEVVVVNAQLRTERVARQSVEASARSEVKEMLSRIWNIVFERSESLSDSDPKLRDEQKAEILAHSLSHFKTTESYWQAPSGRQFLRAELDFKKALEDIPGLLPQSPFRLFIQSESQKVFSEFAEEQNAP